MPFALSGSHRKHLRRVSTLTSSRERLPGIRLVRGPAPLGETSFTKLFAWLRGVEVTSGDNDQAQRHRLGSRLSPHFGGKLWSDPFNELAGPRIEAMEIRREDPDLAFRPDGFCKSPDNPRHGCGERVERDVKRVSCRYHLDLLLLRESRAFGCLKHVSRHLRYLIKVRDTGSRRYSEGMNSRSNPAEDSYKPVAGSIFVSITVNKNLWGYGFSKVITLWVEKGGFVKPIMLNMCLAVLWCLCAIPF
ncbi:hypothetical protein NUU61_008401 [Penicillium alfredii]|uniref:Uncharacterized protein n=1 Tax=Penicillium alfredii TaxID=1506179 RepID=A0A9W9ESJ3_9EURO|nr:uncharacterized protein NUU61_008401 [Penicillium alfredii]KAJ5087094.1 hypothetical protein NUU61_008401 [Penicillium alfredii]